MDPECLYAWLYFVTDGGSAPSYMDAIDRVAGGVGELARAHVESAVSLSKYASHFGWAPVLRALAQMGLVPESPIPPPTKSFTDPLRDAYRLLGIEPTATIAEIRSAYLTAARRWHPDTLGDIPEELSELATERMADINSAYELLDNQRHA
jgi:DnaJ-domain-containing protein 1